jgi:transporter family-2 protein
MVYALAAGIFVSLQGVFNARLSEKAGFWLTNAWVHGTGLLISIVICLVLKDGQWGKLLSANKLYWLGGAASVIIIFCIAKGISMLGAAYAVALLFAAQILFTFFIDHYGWFGSEKIPFTYNKAAGIAVMIAGVILYKIK